MGHLIMYHRMEERKSNYQYRLMLSSVGKRCFIRDVVFIEKRRIRKMVHEKVPLAGFRIYNLSAMRPFTLALRNE